MSTRTRPAERECATALSETYEKQIHELSHVILERLSKKEKPPSLSSEDKDAKKKIESYVEHIKVYMTLVVTKHSKDQKKNYAITKQFKLNDTDVLQYIEINGPNSNNIRELELLPLNLKFKGNVQIDKVFRTLIEEIVENKNRER